MIVVIATIALMIFLNGMYVAAEFATVSARRTRVNQLAGDGNRMAKMLLPIMENSKALDNYVAACQVGITISSLVVGAYAQSEIATRLVDPLTYLLELVGFGVTGDGGVTATAVANPAAVSIASISVLASITILQVVMGELFPKSIAIQYPEQMAIWLVIPMRWSLFVLRPFIILFNGSGRLILRVMGRESGKHSQLHSPAEIEMLVTESHESGLLDATERQLLRNAFRLRDLLARQVMVHRTKIVAAAITDSVIDVMNLALEVGYSRIPVYKDSIDEINGFVHVKDLFRLHVEGQEAIKSVVRDVIYVPETLPVGDVWERFNDRRKYVAVVFDEYGGTAGLITFEDLIEEIFGELQDEFDDEMALIARDKDGRIYLRGDLLITDVNEYLQLNLPNADADTLSGLIISQLGRPPDGKEEVEIDGICIRVEAMEDLGVSEVSLLLTAVDDIPDFNEWEMADHD